MSFTRKKAHTPLNLLVLLPFLCMLPGLLWAQKGAQNAVSLVYVDIAREQPGGVPAYLTRPQSEGTQGALTAVNDANITGKFLGYSLSLSVVNTDLSASTSWISDHKDAIQSANVILLDSPSELYSKAVSQLAAENPNALLFNVAVYQDDTRNAHCTLPLLHTIPSYQMKTDALGQWFRAKRISDVFVLNGNHPDDAAYAKAFLNTAKKFKLDVVAQKKWQASFDLRRSAFAEIPAFTRTSDEYEAVFAADAMNQFAYSLPFNTYYIVPVTGDAGLQAENWHHTHEQWGARQLQNRFKEQYGRPMNDIDFASYVAVIAVSTALQQGSPADGQSLYHALLNEKMSIAAYKGRKLSFRIGSRQLRQPIVLAHQDALVAHAPLAGFLHQTNELDTLGNPNQVCKETPK